MTAENLTAPPDRKTTVSGAMQLAAITAASYWIAFTHELAYVQFFGVPLQLVHIGPDLVLVVAATILGGLWGFFGLAQLIAMLWPEHFYLQEKLGRISVAALIMAWLMKYYGFGQWWLWLYIAICIYIALFEVLWPLVVHRRAGPFRERFIADEVREYAARSRGIFGRLAKVLGPLYPVLLVTLLGTLMAYISGDGEATTQEEFLVLETEPGIALIRMYPELVVCVRFDAGSHTITGLQVRKLSEVHALLLVRKTIGPLHLKPYPGYREKH